MRRAIKKIMSEVTDECVITSCGYISREVYRAKDRDRNFYCQGAMGAALAVGLGLAYQRKELKVIVISGDGAVLMSLGTQLLHYSMKMPNLKHFILDNGCYASTGGQKNCFRSLGWFYFTGKGTQVKIIQCGKKSNAPRIPLKCSEIARRFQNAIQKEELERKSKRPLSRLSNKCKDKRTKIFDY